jgi:hypothetical protein
MTAEIARGFFFATHALESNIKQLEHRLAALLLRNIIVSC